MVTVPLLISEFQCKIHIQTLRLSLKQKIWRN